MVEVNLYKFGAVLVTMLVGAVIVTLIDTGMDIKWESYPWWKQLAHKVVYIAFGGIIMVF